MALTKVQIISSAANLLNKGPITSISSADVFASSAEDTFDYLLPSILAKKNWRFATALIQLSQKIEVPIVDEWQYIYTLPADYLALVRTYPYSLNFQIYQNQLLYTNLSELKIEYRFLPDISKLPAHFVEYFIWELAASMSLTGSSSESLYKTLALKANDLRIQATAADSQSHPNQAIVSHPFAEVRGGGVFPYHGSGNY